LPWLERLCSLFFAIELLLRILCDGCDFFSFSSREAIWNYLDVAVVSASIVEEVVSHFSSFSFPVTAIRILRLMRVTKVVLTIRVSRAFRELRMMIMSCVHCVKSLFWALCLLFIVVYMFGMVFMGACIDSDGLSDAEEGQLKSYFGSFPRTLLSLFQSVSGGIDWAEPAEALLAVGWAYAVIFCLYIALTTVAVLNIVTGIFVESATKTAKHDRHTMIMDYLHAKKSFVEDVCEIFREADTDGSGTISLSEFVSLLSEEKVNAFFTSLEIEISDPRGLFELLDDDASGEISIEEFIFHCLRLRGSKGVDMARLLRQNQQLSERMDDVAELVSAIDMVVEQPHAPTPPESDALR